MPTYRFKTANHERIRNLSKKASTIIQNEFLETNTTISTIGSTISANDSSMSIMFPNTLVYSIVTSAQSNFIFNIKRKILEESQVSHPIIIETLFRIQRMVNAKTLTDAEGYIIKSAHTLLNNSYNALISANILQASTLREMIVEFSTTYKLIVADSTTDDIAGQSDAYIANANGENIYENISVEALGSDSLDVSQPGLTANEAYRLFFFNGERIQQITATYDTDASSTNPGQYGTDRLHILSGATLSDPINKI